ncbi:MAG: hypothetical protein LC109_09360 [Bacteroidia bacterium]|nr:hypothetical protein [Bacteroidia bacterium]
MIKHNYKPSQLIVIETCAAIARMRIALETEIERTWKNGEFHDLPMQARSDFIALKGLLSGLKFHEGNLELSEKFKNNVDLYGCIEWAEKVIEKHKDQISEIPKTKTKPKQKTP